MFYKRSKLTSIDFGDGFNTSNVVSMTRVVDTAYSGVPSIRVRFGMFAGCSNLTSLDLSVFNTSQVTDMRGLFENCSKLTSLNVSSFNTSNVEYMDAMFLGCSSLTSLDLSNFNTSNVVTMGYPFTESHSGYHGEGHHPTPPSGMFAYCRSLTSLNLSSFNTSKVTNMYTMFFECINMTHLDLSNFEVSQTSLNSVFAGINGKWFAVVSGACTIICTEATQARLEPLIPPDVVVTWERP
ncbi:MAG: BspA family leucine-rich repeat surface protein [Bacteroidales bacterium]|nr:BspA family leucine-rich repeat surface protein [Bacteroidales bacterium]